MERVGRGRWEGGKPAEHGRGPSPLGAAATLEPEGPRQLVGGSVTVGRREEKQPASPQAGTDTPFQPRKHCGRRTHRDPEITANNQAGEVYLWTE